MALDENSETFVMYIATLEAKTIHPFWTAQIAILQWDKTPTEILAEYFDYANEFSLDLAMELLENMGMNKDVIKLIDEKPPPYGPIYTFN